jgi:hypothetical protein
MAKTRELTFTLAVLLKCNAAFLRPLELWNRQDPSKLIDLVWLWFRSPHDQLAAIMMRTSDQRIEP